jgi:hypothetical protein
MIHVLTLEIYSLLAPVLIVRLWPASRTGLEESGWPEILSDLGVRVCCGLNVLDKLGGRGINAVAVADANAINPRNIYGVARSVMIRVSRPQSARKHEIMACCVSDFVCDAKNPSRYVSVGRVAWGGGPRYGAGAPHTISVHAIKTEGVRKIDGIPTRIAVQVEPPRQPNRVRLRELARSKTAS